MALDTALHISATQMFIDANPSDITLTRTPMVSDGAGGKVAGTPSTLDPQVMRLVGLNNRAASQTRITFDGETVVPTFALIAPPSADMQAGDQFMFEGKLHEVVFVNTHPEWRKQGEVFRHA